MKHFLLFVALLISSSACTADSRYSIDEIRVEALFENAKDVSLLAVAQNISLGNSSLAADEGSDTQLIAGIVAGAEFLTLLWFLPIHRIILDGFNAGIFFGYFCTLGMCGILPLVDAIILLVGAEGTKYIGCKKFFMWGCKGQSE